MAECLDMEFQVAKTFMNNDDFFEGVSCTIIDRSKTPVWNPGKLDDVADNIIDSYFALEKKDSLQL